MISRGEELKARLEKERRDERKEAKPLYDLVREIIDKHEQDTDISPSWVAGEVLTKKLKGLGVKRDFPLIYVGCHLQLRQITRGECANRWAPDKSAEEGDQHPLFPDLQQRYPIARKAGEEPVYRLLEQLSHEDRLYNIERLRKEAKAKQRHADALEAYDRQMMELSATEVESEALVD